MMADPEFVVDPDFADALVRKQLDDLGALLRQSTVFLAVKDDEDKPTRIAGSGVLADLYGTKVVLTAGHVLRDFKRQFEDGRMMLSINQRRGNFSLRSDCDRHTSDGDEHGADAGVLIIPPDQVETYFQGGGFQPTRATTLIPTVPRLGVACIVSGFTAEGAQFFTAEGPGGAYSWVHATLAVVSARLVESDGLHHWLDASRPSGDTKAIEPGEFNGMSGCGFWSVSMKPDPISTTPLTY
jgi:hypothetical protein